MKKFVVTFMDKRKPTHFEAEDSESAYVYVGLNWADEEIAEVYEDD